MIPADRTTLRVDKAFSLCFIILMFLVVIFFIPLTAHAQVHKANPSTYKSSLARLKSGDRLELAAGTYSGGLSLNGLRGTVDEPIVISGPAKGAPALFHARGGHDTVEVFGCCHVVVRNLELDGKGLAVNGVNARSSGGQVHDITIENLIIKNHGTNQQIVGISTNQTATWNWTIRNNVIIGAGTGMYLGNSDGTNPFVNGLIEYNYIANTVGYNIQVKHQVGRPKISGMPTKGRTLIRHNVFCKEKPGKGKSDGARPNLLVGHFPDSGDGSKDVYLVYGNFFYQNHSKQPLFQGEGNIALYNNLFVNTLGNAVQIGRHNGRPKMIRVFNNTVVAKGQGIRVGGGDSGYKQMVMGNAVYASGSISGSAVSNNLSGSYEAAAKVLVRPHAPPGDLDLFPKAGALRGRPLSASDINAFQDWDKDFNGNKRNRGIRGAYAGGGQNPGWLPNLERKPVKGPYDLMAGMGPYVKLAGLAKQIKSGTGLGIALKTLRAKLKSADKAEAQEAKMMFEALEGEANRLFKEAQAMKGAEPLAALARMERLASQFAGDSFGAQVSKEAQMLRRNPKVVKELQAEDTWKKVEMMVQQMKPHDGKKDHGSAEFRKKNLAAIRIMLGGCKMIVQRYPGTAAAKRAAEMLDRYK